VDPFQTIYYSENVVALGIKPGTSGSEGEKTVITGPQRQSAVNIKKRKIFLALTCSSVYDGAMIRLNAI
jgi:hypothetical protein